MADTIRTEIRRHLQQGADDLNNQPICDGDNFIAFQVPDGAGCGIVRHNVIIKSVTGKEKAPPKREKKVLTPVSSEEMKKELLLKNSKEEGLLFRL